MGFGLWNRLYLAQQAISCILDDDVNLLEVRDRVFDGLALDSSEVTLRSGLNSSTFGWFSGKLQKELDIASGDYDAVTSLMGDLGDGFSQPR